MRCNSARLHIWAVWLLATLMGAAWGRVTTKPSVGIGWAPASNAHPCHQPASCQQAQELHVFLGAAAQRAWLLGLPMHCCCL